MRRLALLIASSLFHWLWRHKRKTGSFVCEQIPGEGDKFKTITLEDRQKEIDKYESLAAYHKEELPWVYDKETGDLYEYDDFEEAFVPVKDFDYSSESDPYNKSWDEYSAKFSKDGKKLKIKTVSKSKNILLGESVEGEYFEIFDTETMITVQNSGESFEVTAKCIDVPTAGIDVQWAEN